jgi:hypothetical protein
VGAASTNEAVCYNFSAPEVRAFVWFQPAQRGQAEVVELADTPS